MNLKHIQGNTFYIDAGFLLIPFYKINDKEIILLDSGLESEQKDLDCLLQKNDLRVAGIISSHAHQDHTGNNDYFQKKYGCEIAMSEYEAMICSSPENLKMLYTNYSPAFIEKFGNMVCKTDLKISALQDKITVCGTEFKILQTPGHSLAHICIITPDEVAYLGDALSSHEALERMKIPYTFIWSEDLRSKQNLYDLKCCKYIMAHKGIVDRDITQLIDDNINFINRKSAEVYSVIQGAMTLEEIARAVIEKLKISVLNFGFYDLEASINSFVEYLYEIRALELELTNGYLRYSPTNFRL